MTVWPWNRVVAHIFDKVEMSIQQHTFVKEFKMIGLPSLSEKLEKLLTLLVLYFHCAFLSLSLSKYTSHIFRCPSQCFKTFIFIPSTAIWWSKSWVIEAPNSQCTAGYSRNHHTGCYGWWPFVSVKQFYFIMMYYFLLAL